MQENQKPFIPSWLDDAGLSQPEFRIYCHLCRRADNATGIAWPSYSAMIETCGSSKMTIRRCLANLVERGLIVNHGKPFGGSCRYQVLSSIVPPEGQIDTANSTTTGTIEAAPIVPPQDRNSTTTLPPIVPPEGQEGTPLKVLQARCSKNIHLGELLPPSDHHKKPSADHVAESIYDQYPRKVGKASALVAIKKALKTHTVEFLLEKVNAYASAIVWKDRQFIPYPTTWFNDERFSDDPAEWQQPAPKPKTADHRAEKAAREYPEPPRTRLPRIGEERHITAR